MAPKPSSWRRNGRSSRRLTLPGCGRASRAVIFDGLWTASILGLPSAPGSVTAASVEQRRSRQEPDSRHLARRHRRRRCPRRLCRRRPTDRDGYRPWFGASPPAKQRMVVCREAPLALSALTPVAR